MKKSRKIIGYTLGTLVVLAGAAFLLNLHLTTHLERFLRAELARRTAEATDGFYRLSFDRLSIRFFNGELKIEGIKLHPDSIVFAERKRKGDLPPAYVKADVGMIDFKGINLTWRRSYKQLHFNSFEIRNPDIQVFAPYSQVQKEKKAETETKTLYEIISPYIDILTVRELNLENASASFLVENPVSPITYALHDVNFHAYGFRLDQNSSHSGKLLYCDDFDFTTNQPQILLTNNDFSLQTDRILLNTKDSSIIVSHIALTPQKALWEKRQEYPDNYVEATVRSIDIRGIQFHRENGQNNLAARSFDIISSDIQAFDGGHRNRPSASAVSVRPLSLYELISPVFHSVTIGTIGIEKAKLQYSSIVKDTTEIYRLANFDFRTNGFRIDSLSEFRHGLWYSRDFSLEAKEMEGLMAAHNHRLTVKRMALDTKSGNFDLEQICLRPLSVHSRNDYMSGDIKAVRARGLQYDKGISARQVHIDDPDLHYVAVSRRKESGKSRKPLRQSDNRKDVKAILNPFLRYLSVGRINLNHAHIAVEDQNAPEPVIYQLDDFHFFATDILMDQQTERSRGLFFDYGNIGFQFSRFDNYLPGKAHKLSIRKGRFSTVDGVLQLDDVKLFPQPSIGQKAETAVCFSSPRLRLAGLKRSQEYMNRSDIRITAFQVDSPYIQLLKADGEMLSGRMKQLRLDGFSRDSSVLRLGTIEAENPIVDILSGRTPTDSLSRGKKAAFPDVYSLLEKTAKKIFLKELNLTEAYIRYAYYGKEKDSLHYQTLDTTSLHVKGLEIDNLRNSYKCEDIRFSTRNLAFPLDNGFYTLQIGGIDLSQSEAQISHIRLFSPYSKMQFAYLHPRHQDWFDVNIESIALSGIDLLGYFAEKKLRIQDIQVTNATLQNFKNKKIPGPRHIVPMIYSGLQKAPLKLDFQKVDVNNLSVIYEELAQKGKAPGKLFFTDMNGTFSGFTNIISRPAQYIRLDVTGKLMGEGAFNAVWKLPVDSLNNRFLLEAHMTDFDLTALNPLLIPLASAEIRSGNLRELTFSTEASSQKATIRMQFLYNDLKVTLLKDQDGELTDKKFLSGLVNRVLKQDNPDKTEERIHKPRISNVSIIRDPYHSTFNYIWQIMRPALIESVGVSKKKQETVEEITGLFTKVKKFFRSLKKSPAQKGSKEKSQEEEQKPLSSEVEPTK